MALWAAKITMKGDSAMDHDVMDDEQLNVLLKQREVPEMRSNLAHRIIEAARDVPQEKAGLDKLLEKSRGAGHAFLKGVANVSDHVALPQPVFAVAMVVVMIGGAVLGFIGEQTLYDSSDVEAYIMATDSFEYGDFL